jgi:hypothetical protein
MLHGAGMLSVGQPFVALDGRRLGGGGIGLTAASATCG